jgi:hypothetical protein
MARRSGGPALLRLLKRGFPPTLALYDGAAAHFVGTRLKEVVSSRPTAAALLLSLIGCALTGDSAPAPLGEAIFVTNTGGNYDLRFEKHQTEFAQIHRIWYPPGLFGSGRLIGIVSRLPVAESCMFM